MENIQVPTPVWGSRLSDVILRLEKLRAPTLQGSVPPAVFFQLKSVFHMLETLGSARIEGNHTTLADYVETKLDAVSSQGQMEDPQKELENIESAIAFIEDTLTNDIPIDRAFISQLHQLITDGLNPKEEGSMNPGELRQVNVKIAQSKHSPPDMAVISEHFEALVELMNREHSLSYQLLAVAIAHHRFAHIHPFDNGNGRVGRVLSYALLIKLGFNVKKGGRLMNPSAVFYTNRDSYYDRLAAADSLEDKDLLDWAEYYLDGLLDAILKVDRLLNRDYIEKQILLPAITRAKQFGRISDQDFSILKYLIKQPSMSMKAEELALFGFKSSKQKSAVISLMRNADLLTPTKPSGRIYTIKIIGKGVLRDVIEALKQEDFVPEFLENN